MNKKYLLGKYNAFCYDKQNWIKKQNNESNSSTSPFERFPGLESEDSIWDWARLIPGFETVAVEIHQWQKVGRKIDLVKVKTLEKETS